MMIMMKLYLYNTGYKHYKCHCKRIQQYTVYCEVTTPVTFDLWSPSLSLTSDVCSSKRRMQLSFSRRCVALGVNCYVWSWMSDRKLCVCVCAHVYLLYKRCCMVSSRASVQVWASEPERANWKMKPVFSLLGVFISLTLMWLAERLSGRSEVFPWRLLHRVACPPAGGEARWENKWVECWCSAVSSSSSWC